MGQNASLRLFNPEQPAPAGRQKTKAWQMEMFCKRRNAELKVMRMASSGLWLLGGLFGGVDLRCISHGPGVTVGGVVGRDLQPLGGGSSLQHDILRDLLISFLGLLIFRLGSETDVSITPTFCSGHETPVLLLRKVPNYGIQIGVRHGLFSSNCQHNIPFNQVCNCWKAFCDYAAGECASCFRANVQGRSTLTVRHFGSAQLARSRPWLW
jgi:hypothetical protein